MQTQIAKSQITTQFYNNVAYVAIKSTNDDILTLDVDHCGSFWCFYLFTIVHSLQIGFVKSLDHINT